MFSHFGTERKKMQEHFNDSVISCFIKTKLMDFDWCIPVIHTCAFRHDKYRTQYRAMFVMNCTVKREEVLRYKTEQQKKQRNRKRRRGQKAETAAGEAPEPSPAGMDADEVYHPVQCSECSTEVAVFDKEEVYHFFNILASHCWDTEWTEQDGSIKAALLNAFIKQVQCSDEPFTLVSFSSLFVFLAARVALRAC